MADPVTFVYADWIVAYPEFSTIPEATAESYFDMATGFLRNDGTSPVSSTSTQTTLLYLLTAHIAKLFGTVNGQAASDLVGRISSATEGSVSVSVDLPQLPQSAAWFSQTKYGLMFWQMTAAYRTARYVPGPQRVFNPMGMFWRR